MSDATETWLTDPRLELAAAVLAYVVAAVHLFHPSHGFGRLALVLSFDAGLLAADPRPLAFVLLGLAILAAVPLAIERLPRRPLYVAGAVLMAVTVLGYVGWHLSGHGGFLPGREPLYHGLTPLEALVGHLTTDPWAAVALPAELLLAVVLVVLYRRSAPSRPRR